jgi:hypothetical protein
MAVQIVSDQIGAQQVTAAKVANNSITSNQMDMGQTFNFTGNLQTGGNLVASQAYVDGKIAGLSWKESVKVATDAALPACTYDNGTSGVGATLTADGNGALSVDGQAMSTNDRLLIRNQAAGQQNGLFVVTNAGNAGAAFVLTRSTDADTSAELENAAVFVKMGTENANIAFTQTADNITIGTTVLSFTAFSGTEAINAGDGISKNGDVIALSLNTLSPAVLSVSADSIPFIDGAGNNKKESIVDLASAMAGSGLSAASGQIALSNNAVTVASGAGLSGGGSIALGASGTLSLNLNGLSAATVDVSADSMAIIDGGDNTSKKESIADLVSAMAGAGISASAGVMGLTNNAVTVSAGTGLTGGGAVQLGASITMNSDLNSYPDLASVDMNADKLPIIDGGDSSSKKMTLVQLASGLAGAGLSSASGVMALTANSVTVSGGNGLSGGGAVTLGGSTSLALDLNELDGSANIDVGTDFITFIDSGDSNTSKKQSISHLTTALAGAGLANASGQLRINTNGVTANELADNAVDTAAIADDAVTIAKIGARAYTEDFAGSSSTTYDLARAVDANWADRVQVFRNGLRCVKKSSGPADESEYTVGVTAGTGGVCRITFGAAPNTDKIVVDYMT